MPSTSIERHPFHIMTKPIGPLCNLDCEYCYYLEKEFMYPQGTNFRMSDDVLENYVRQYIESQPGPHVQFAWQGGEPTLMGLDFFQKAVRLQQKYLPQGWQCANALQTNGTLLTPEWCEFFREHDFLIGISIDGPAAMHNRYRFDKGHRPTHDKVMRGLKLLQDHGVEYNVLCVVNDVNAAHPLEVYNFFKEHGVNFLQFIPIVEPEGPGGQVSSRSVAAKDYGAFLSTIFDEWVRHDIGSMFVQIFEECFAVWLGRPASLCIFRETCGDALALEHNGDLFSCDHFVEPEFKLGNINERPMVELLALEAQHDFGQAKRDTLPDYCLNCEVHFMCRGGCPKNRFINTPTGEQGLNYLCEGYRKFFNHVDPYLNQMVALWNDQQPPQKLMAFLRDHDEKSWQQLSRNDTCLCGSGRKFKRCCMSKDNKPVPVMAYTSTR